MTPIARGPLRSLTSTRIVAALWVVTYHLAGPSEDSPVHRLVRMGYSAVEFFFVLSGFILAYSYLGRRTEPRDFWLARFARIYPVYGLALVLALPALFDLSHYTGIGAKGIAVRAGAAALMLQSWWPPTALNLNGPSWSLSVEALFYTIFPFALPILGRLERRSLVAWLFGVAAVGLAISLVFQGVYPDASPESVAGAQTWPNFFPPLHLPAFLFGAILGRLFVERSGEPSPTTLAVVGWGAVLTIVLVAQMHAFFMVKHSGGLIVPFGLLIWALAHERGPSARALTWPPLVLLGEASYGLYILQWPVLHGWSALGAGLRTTWLTLDTSGGQLLYTTALTLIAVFVYRFFELPARAFLRARLTRLRPMPVA